MGRDDDLQDLTERCTQMKQGIAQAYQHWLAVRRQWGIDAANDDEVLKLFMAPEFFFRGKHGAYPISFDFARANGKPADSELTPLLTLKKLRDETGKGEYKDWLFVPGTCVCYTEKEKVDVVTEADPQDPLKQRSKRDAQGKTSGQVTWTGVIMENFALVQKGGFPEPNPDPSSFHYVEKRFISGIDYVFDKNDKVVLKASGPAHEWIKPETTKGSRREQNELGSCFEMDGIRFGLEVCLDHAKSRLHKAADKGAVQIHLVTSAGMSREYTLPPSIFFLVDGLNRNLECMIDIGGHQLWAEPERFPETVNGALFPRTDALIRIFEPLYIP
jgi:hypothetical protein